MWGLASEIKGSISAFLMVITVGAHIGTSQNGNRYVLQNGTCYISVRVKNGTVTKLYLLQNSMCYKTVRHNPVHVTKRYILYSTMNAPSHGLVGHLFKPNLTQDMGIWSVKNNTTPPTH
jgi:hypothetical protein